MRRFLPIVLAVLAFVSPALAQNQMDIGRHFDGLDGCFVLYDLKTGAITRCGAHLSAIPRPAASTFEIFDALVAVQTGAVKDENTTLGADGLTLASAMKNSEDSYFAQVTKAIGAEQMQHWLDTVGYGHRSIASGVDPNVLKISADDQAAFLIRLYKKRLPFDQGTMDLVRRLLILREESGFTLSGKTGTVQRGDSSLGWFIGHLRTADGDEYVVATNIDGKKDADGEKAQAITEAIFTDLELMPTNPVDKKKIR